MSKIKCIHCGGILSVDKKILPNDVNSKTGTGKMHEFLVCHKCRQMWDLSEKNPYITEKRKAGNLLVDFCAGLSTFIGLIYIFKNPVILALIILFWLIFYTLWDFSVKNDLRVDNDGLQKRMLLFLVMLMTMSFAIMINDENNDKSEDTTLQSTNAEQSNNENQDAINGVSSSEIHDEPQTEITTSNDVYTNIANELNPNIAQQFVDILNNGIGFTETSYISKEDGMNLFYINANGHKVAATLYDDEIYQIFIPNSNHTFYEDGQVKLTYEQYSDSVIPQADMSYYYAMVQEFIESNLKNPSSAKFPSQSEITYQKKGNIVAINGYVDAKNSFDAKIRTEYIVEMEVIDKESFSYNVIYFKIGDDEYGTWQNLK